MAKNGGTSKSEQARQLLIEGKLTPAEIAETVGCSKGVVYSQSHQLKRRKGLAEKRTGKRGRPRSPRVADTSDGVEAFEPAENGQVAAAAAAADLILSAKRFASSAGGIRQAKAILTVLEDLQLSNS